jgi:PAS domain S-box-containing protein
MTKQKNTLASEASHLEEALRESNELFRLIVDSATDYAIFTMRVTGEVTSWNTGARRLLGYEEAEILGQNGRIIFTPEEIKNGEAEKEIQKALSDGRAEDERWHVRQDGSRFFASGVLMVLRGREGRPRGLLKILRDTTLQKQSEQELQSLLRREKLAREQFEVANRVKDEFLATISHELRTPLNAILGWVVMLRGGSLTKEKAAQALETIERAARSQNKLIEDLLDASRILMDKLRIEFRPLDPQAVIEATLEAVRPAAEMKKIRLEAYFEPEIGIIYSDADRLAQIVWNVVGNSIKFTPQGGQIKLNLKRLDSHLELVVSDTGIGIEADFLPLIFDRLRQADSSSTRTQGGLGLGLSIVRHIIELHGGIIRAESPGRGQGTTFRIQLPLIPPGVIDTTTQTIVHAEEGISKEWIPRLDGVRVLVVDDEADAREIIVTLLNETGAEVKAVGGADEALSVFAKWQADVLISDIAMPGKDGYALIKEIRARESGSDGPFPAVALTAYARDKDRLRALAAGFQAHVAKPLEPAELLTVVASLVGKIGRG